MRFLYCVNSFITHCKHQTHVLYFLCYRNLDIAVQGLDNAGVELKFSDVLGDLELGQLTEEYYKDRDLREILSNTALDPNQMASLEGHHLLLVTSVVYSTKFVLQGSRMHQVLLVQSNFVYATPGKSSNRTNLKTLVLRFKYRTDTF